jgi:hypothetical protein
MRVQSYIDWTFIHKIHLDIYTQNTPENYTQNTPGDLYTKYTWKCIH